MNFTLQRFIIILVLIFNVYIVRAEEGVTDTEIHIGQWSPQTGPAAAWGAVARGTGVYFQMINDEGGINGRKIVYHMFDDGYNPARTKAGVKQLQESVGIFAWASGVGTATGLAVKEYLMSRKVPWVGPCSGTFHWITPPQKYLFAIYPLYATEAKVLCQYAVETMQKKKIAIIYQNDDYGKNGLAGAKEQLAKSGINLIAEIPLDVETSDIKPHVLKIKNSEAEIVLLWVTPLHAVKLVGTGKMMQFAPQWMTTSTCADFSLMYSLSNGLWEGVIAPSFSEFALSDVNYTPLMLKYKAAFEKYAAKDERWSVFFWAGIGIIEPMVEAMKKCGNDLTRERFVTEMEGFKDFQGIAGKINFKAFDQNDQWSRQGMNSVFLIQCLKDGKTKKISEWTEIK